MKTINIMQKIAINTTNITATIVALSNTSFSLLKFDTAKKEKISWTLQ